MSEGLSTLNLSLQLRKLGRVSLRRETVMQILIRYHTRFLSYWIFLNFYFNNEWVPIYLGREGCNLKVFYEYIKAFFNFKLLSVSLVGPEVALLSSTSSFPESLALSLPFFLLSSFSGRYVHRYYSSLYQIGNNNNNIKNCWDNRTFQSLPGSKYNKQATYPH